MKERKFKPRNDLTGQIFNYLTPIRYIKGGKWECQCKCGNICIVDTRNLKSSHTKSCGCKTKESKNYYDMTDFETNNIKVIERSGSDNQQIALWKCLCKKCGNTFITRGSSIRAGYVDSCGCVHLKNEQLITKILTDNNISFATQYTFPDLLGVNNGKLRFDFAIFNNNTLSHLIEYNGKQHYEQAEGSWANNFEDLQENDKRKIEYCKLHNIPLIIIKYDQNYTLKDLIDPV